MIAIKKEKMAYFLTNLFISVLFISIVVSLKNINYITWIRYFSIIIILSIIIDFYFVYKSTNILISFAIIFIFLSYIFHLGQVILYAVNTNYEYSYGNYIATSNWYTIDSLIFSFIIIKILVNSVLYFNIISTKKVVLCKRKNFNISRKCLKYMGIIICLITVPMRTIYNINALIVTINQGYTNSLSMGYSGIYIQLSLFYIIGFVALILAYSNNKSLVRKIFLFEILFLIFSMLSGGRIYCVVSMIIIVYIYFNNIEKINYKTIIKYGLLCLIILQIITALATVRSLNELSVYKIIISIFDFENNIIYSILEEFGGTIYSVTRTIYQVPSKVDFGYGSSYILGLGNVLIDIWGGKLYQIVLMSKFTSNLINLSTHGGSYIGELYYNFGYFSYLITPFIGYLINHITVKIHKSFINKDYFKILIYIMPMFSIIIWVRGYFTDIIRGSIWGYCFIFFIYCFVTFYLKYKGVSK